MAKKTASGIVSMVSEKEWEDRDTGEDILLYSFQIEGDKRYFRTGTDDPGVDEGEATKSTSKKSGGENWDARAKYWDKKEKREIEVVEPRITLASCRTQAIELVRTALDNGAVSLGNTKAADKLEIILGAVDDVTHRFYKQSIGGVPFFDNPELSSDVPYDDDDEDFDE